MGSFSLIVLFGESIATNRSSFKSTIRTRPSLFSLPLVVLFTLSLWQSCPSKEVGWKDWQIGKVKFGNREIDSSEILSLPSNAQKGMKADAGESVVKWIGWVTKSGSTP